MQKIALALILILCLSFVAYAGDKKVSQQSLNGLFNSCDRIVFNKVSYDGTLILYKSNDEHDINSLKDSLKIKEIVSFTNPCIQRVGTFLLNLYSSNKQIGQIVISESGTNIRSSIWTCSWVIEIESVNEFHDWCDLRNIYELRARHKNDQKKLIEEMHKMTEKNK